MPITQFLEIKAILMNINVLESSVGPDDVTKRGGKIPPYGQKGTVGPKEYVIKRYGGMVVLYNKKYI